MALKKHPRTLTSKARLHNCTHETRSKQQTLRFAFSAQINVGGSSSIGQPMLSSGVLHVQVMVQGMVCKAFSAIRASLRRVL